jgi:predicted ATP-binding protein involved in virulence
MTLGEYGLPEYDSDTREITLYSKTAKKSIPASTLSQGFQSAFAPIMDLPRRAATANSFANGNPDNIPQTSGLALIDAIDETDSRFHPSWQQTILPILPRTFPNVQFYSCSTKPAAADVCKAGKCYYS